MVQIETYAYTPRNRQRAVVAVICLALTYVFLKMGSSTSFIRENFAEPTPLEHYGFNLLLAFATGVTGLFTLLSLWRNKHCTKGVIISGESVTAPEQGLLDKLVEIPFSEISDVHVTKPEGEAELAIKGGGKRIHISKSRLSNAGDFERIVMRLRSEGQGRVGVQTSFSS